MKNKRKKIVIADISGKVPYYEHALCNSLLDINKDFLLITPYEQEIYSPKYNVKKLPSFYNHTQQGAGRVTKALECLFNYLYMVSYLIFHRIYILHLQWLPFLEYSSLEKIFLSLFKKVSDSKLILTVHNVFPHDMSVNDKSTYINRFSECTKYIDKFVVHTESSKNQLHDTFNIDNNKIEVIYHGVFEPSNKPVRKVKNDGRLRILMFGVQSFYKGTDLLIESISILPEACKQKIDVTIAGKTDDLLYSQFVELSDSLGINWLNRFIDDEELNQLIVDSDLVVFPYREISQSGALLLSMYFKKTMLLSDLPSFKETVFGLPEYCFFTKEDTNMLACRLEQFIEGSFDENKILKTLDELVTKYSWANSSKKTIELYNNI